MVAYARAVGAEPIVQVLLLADTACAPPTADTAAAMVQYGITQGYGIKYFSIGNEPDIYDTPGQRGWPQVMGYTPEDYCAAVTADVAAMKAVDPNHKD